MGEIGDDQPLQNTKGKSTSKEKLTDLKDLLNTLMPLTLLVFGDLSNLDRACLRCLITFLQCSLYNGLLLVGFVEI